MKKSLSLIIGIFLVIIFFLIFKLPLIKTSILTSIRFCIRNLIPAILPLSVTCNFFALTLTSDPNLDISKKYRFRTVLGWIGGYPSGAGLIKSCPLGNENTIREICLISCGSAGYILHIIGISLCQSPLFGICLYLSQILFSALTAPPKSCVLQMPISKSVLGKPKVFPHFAQAIGHTAETMISLSSFTVVFSALSDLIATIFPFPHSQELFRILFEFATGGQLIWSAFSRPLALLLIGFSVGFGGLSIHAQIYCATAELIESYAPILLRKVQCGILTGIFSFLFFRSAILGFLFCLMMVFVSAIKKEYSKNKKSSKCVDEPPTRWYNKLKGMVSI